MKKSISILTVILFVFTGITSAQTYLDPNAPIEERVKDALSRMTVHIKVLFRSQFQALIKTF